MKKFTSTSAFSSSDFYSVPCIIVVIIGAFYLGSYLVADSGNQRADIQPPVAVVPVSLNPATSSGSETIPTLAQQAEQILSSHCYECHSGIDAEAELDLTPASMATYLSETDFDQPAFRDRLIHLITSTDLDNAMPPEGARLNESEVAILQQWADAGFDLTGLEDRNHTADEVANHWAFQPIIIPEVPHVSDPEWDQHPLDAIVYETAKKAGVSEHFTEIADRNTLCRRLYLDIIGLPPTVNELNEFLNDDSPEAVTRLIDRLLASSHFGEHWGRHWLDAARYADSDGYERDALRPYAWRYRDWVINAFNQNMSFAEFTRFQIAGDLIADSEDYAALLGTGFHRNVLVNRCPGVDTDKVEYDKGIDRLNTVGTVWLGLTLNCAQCHDHKYDPVSQQEYYQLLAYFRDLEDLTVETVSMQDSEAADHVQLWRTRHQQWLTSNELDEHYKWWESTLQDYVRTQQEATKNQELKEDMSWYLQHLGLRNLVDRGREKLMTPADQRTRREQFDLTLYFLRNVQKVLDDDEVEGRLEELRAEFIALDEELQQAIPAPIVRARQTPEKMHRHTRGDFYLPAEEVAAATPSFLPKLQQSDSPPTRVELADWILSRQNPLTARVIVNQIWMHYFGEGLVASPDNFGLLCEQPAQLELLNWLAAEFRESDWNIKQIHRLILTSRIYQLSTKSAKEIASETSRAYLLSQNRIRVPAETLRDSILRASGMLNVDRIGGPSIFPPQPVGLEKLGQEAHPWVNSAPEEQNRRSLYIHFQRTTPFPQLMLFDMPSSNLPVIQRSRSITPLQSLCLLNDKSYQAATQHLARQIISTAESAQQRYRLLFSTCLSRDPSHEEVEHLQLFVRQTIKPYLESNPAAAAGLTSRIKSDSASIDRKELTTWALVARVIINLDEFITRK